MIWMYLVALACFLAIDAVVLKFLMLPLFSRYIGDMLRKKPSSAWPSASRPLRCRASLSRRGSGARGAEPLAAVKNGAVLGFISYGTYEATNMATLRGWAWPMLAADISWGTILSATVAAIAYGVGRAVV